MEGLIMYHLIKILGMSLGSLSGVYAMNRVPEKIDPRTQKPSQFKFFTSQEQEDFKQGKKLLSDCPKRVRKTSPWAR